MLANQTNRGTFERLISASNGGQENRIISGTRLLPEQSADKIGREKSTPSNPIRNITQLSSGKYLVQGDSKTLLANESIVAMSLPVAGLISYSPPISPKRQKLKQRMFMSDEER